MIIFIIKKHHGYKKNSYKQFIMQKLPKIVNS